MKRSLLILIISSYLAFGCRKIQVDGGLTTINNGQNESTVLEGRITTNRTLYAGYTYKLRGLVYVTNGAVLTIEPGTKIVGETGQKGGLIITRNAKISADGTVDRPIVFTSESATPARGDWAGVVILGNAPTNSSYNGNAGIGEIEGGINNSEGLGLYGGTNPADNSGTLRYVRIEYAGYAFLPDKEVNGLTFGGVGNQTIVDYVQVSFANDDSFEWFGGTVNCKHLISFRTLDDDFDTDNGFSGKVQFGIALRDSSVADISKSEAFESDNDANGSTVLPQTSAVFSNMTVLGPKVTSSTNVNSLFLGAVQIRRNSAQSIFNSLIMGWPTGLFVDATKGSPTDNNIPASLFMQYNIIAGCPTAVLYGPSSTTPTGASTASINTWFSLETNANKILHDNTDVGLLNPFNYTNPDFNPGMGSNGVTGANFSNNKLADAFFVKTGTYKGACAPGDTWWKTWTKFM